MDTESGETGGEEDEMPSAAAKKKPAKKKSTKITLTEKTIPKVVKLIAVGVKEPPEIKYAAKFVEKSRGTMKLIADLDSAIEHYKSGDDRYVHLANICKIIPTLYRRFGSDVNHTKLTMAKQWLESRGHKVDNDEFIKIQLDGLFKNFPKATYCHKENIITVETDDCFAKGVCFGPFRIKLWLNTGHLRLRALEPNSPPGLSREVVHPHMDRNDGDICLGRGRDAFYKAVKENRFCDALLIVRSVLNEYGSSNPYYSLDLWKKAASHICVTCGAESATLTCRGCRKAICEEHCFRCSRCGSVVCADHVNSCRDCDEPLCGPCRRNDKTCGHCGKSTDSDWMERVEEYKKIVVKPTKHKRKPKPDKERLGGGFLK
jgi:hypothetical protein